MTNQDYQLEELENAAVNKSNNAKRAAMIAAGVVGTAATAGAATHAYDTYTDDPEHQEVDNLNTEELDNMAKAGADVVHEPEVKPEPVNHNGSHTGGGHTPSRPTQNDTDIDFNRTTEIYDSEGRLVSTAIDGQVEGRDFRLVDIDGDKKADLIALDVNGDGTYQDDEIVELNGSDQIDMHVDTRYHNVLVLNEEPEPYSPETPDKSDIAYNPDENRYNEEKTDEIYTSDDDSDNSYAYEDDYKDEADYYGDLDENDSKADQLDDLGNDSFDLV